MTEHTMATAFAVNTGSLPDSVLTDAGASVVFGSMKTLLETIPEIRRLTQAISI